MAIRVQQNPADFGRCGCGRREYCDGSHALTELQWQAKLARERALEEEKAAAAEAEQSDSPEIPGK